MPEVVAAAAAAAAARDGGTTPANGIETIYHVRIIQAWSLEEGSSSASASQERARFSFFGLELELVGFQTGSNVGSSSSSDVPVPVTCPLQFTTPASVGNALQETQLATIVGPFKIRVVGKMAPSNPAASDTDRLVLQKFIAVQPDNLLLEINSVHFLATCSTGNDVHRCLLRVLTRVSLAQPFELTFQRHNHPQAAAKIVPFAARADVQVAQVAQYKKLQEQEAQLSEAVKRKKQFITQQMDYEQEQYLFDHIGVQLFVLYEETMANAQWQAYEFGQALWYYHAPESRLYAEHPMRSSEKTRQLIGTTQLRTRFAVQKMQRATRIGLRRKRITDAVVDRHLFDRVWGELWQQAWTKIWTDDLLPLHTPSASTNSSVEEEVEKLWNNWLNRNLQPVKAADAGAVPVAPRVVSSGPQLADVVKNGIPSSIPPKQKPATPPTVNIEEDKQQVAPSIVSTPSTHLVSHPQPDPSESIELTLPVATAASEDEQSTESAEQAGEDPSLEDKPSELRNDDDDDDNEDDPARWKGYLTLLKTNLKQKKASPPKKHRAPDQSKQSWRGKSDSTATKLEMKHPHSGGAYVDSEDKFSCYLPLVTRNISNGNGADFNSQTTHPSVSSSSLTRRSSSIVPSKARDVAPFMLSNNTQQQYAAYDRGQDDLPPYLSQVLPTHIDPRKADSRSVLPAPALLKHVDSFEDVDSWHRSGSFRAFHSFFARNLDDSGDTNNDIGPHEHHTDNHAPVVHWEKQASVVINQQHRQHEYSTQPYQPVSPFPQRSQQPCITEANTLPANAASSSLAQQKSFTATEMEILLRQDRSSPLVSKAPIPSSTSPTKLPYIVRRKKNGQR